MPRSGAARAPRFHYAVDSRTRPTAKPLIALLAPLCIASGARADECHHWFSPETVLAPANLNDYGALHAFLAGRGIVAAQEPRERIER